MSPKLSNYPDLEVIFHDLNEIYFEKKLPLPRLHWNSRFRSSAGRFTPGSRQKWSFKRDIPMIEVATYLAEEEKGYQLIQDTIAHEMIHYWLWFRKRPYGHSSEFYRKMKEIGAMRYNPVPRERPPKHLYQCSYCKKNYPARRRWKGKLACYECCKKYHRGVYHEKFKLVFLKSL